MVVDRQKVKTRSGVQSTGGTEWQTGSWSRQTETFRQMGKKSRNRQGSKLGGQKKGEMQKAGERENTLVDLEIYKTNWHRETGNTGINTLGKISDTWRGWRQSQGQVTGRDTKNGLQ